MKYRTNQIKTHLLIFIFILIGMQICVSEYSYAQKFTFKNGLKRGAINFVKAKNAIVIPILINGKGPFNFLLDTGVDPLVVTDTSLLKALRLINLKPISINGVGEGKTIKALFSTDVDLEVNETLIERIPTVFLENDVFNLSSYLGVKIHGLLGYYFFNSFVVRINYISNKLSFSLPGVVKKIKGTKIDLEFLENKPYINTELKLDSLGIIKSKLIIDCGAGHALSLESYLENAFPIPKQNIVGNLGVGLGGEINGRIGRISNIKLGSYELQNVLTNFPNYEDVAAKTNQKKRTGNIGAEILTRFHVTFDYQNHAMYLKKNERFRSVFEHDMSGMELYSTEENGAEYFISRIEVDSPAEKSGLMVNDQITGINFKKVENYSLDEITNLLKTQNGQVIIIEVWRKDHYVVKILKLKKRI